MFRLLIITLAVICITSCTIQKRQYLPGYHVEWHAHARKSKESSPQIEEIREALVPNQKTDSITSGKVTSSGKAEQEFTEVVDDESEFELNVDNENLPIASVGEESALTITSLTRIERILNDRFQHQIKFQNDDDQEEWLKKKKKKRKGLFSKSKHPGKIGGLLTVLAFILLFLPIIIALKLPDIGIGFLVFLMIMFILAGLVGSIGFFLAIRSVKKHRLKKDAFWVLLALGFGPFFLFLLIGLPVAFILALII